RSKTLGWGFLLALTASAGGCKKAPELDEGTHVSAITAEPAKDTAPAAEGALPDEQTQEAVAKANDGDGADEADPGGAAEGSQQPGDDEPKSGQPPADEKKGLVDPPKTTPTAPAKPAPPPSTTTPPKDDSKSLTPKPEAPKTQPKPEPSPPKTETPKE